MNNGNAIQPVVDLATNSNYPYVYPNMGGFGNVFGGDGAWFIILFALIFMNNGFGGWGNNGVNNLATTDFVSSQFTQNTLQDLSTQMCSGFANVNSNISNGFADAATNLCNVRSDILTGNMGIQNSIMDAKYAGAINASNTQRDILVQTTQLENQLSNVALSNQAHIDSCCCAIKQAIREDGEATRALITSNTIQDLRDTIADKDRALQTANFNASQIDQTAALINTLAPRSIPAYITSSPYQSIYNPYYNGGYYGNGFYGNTVI